MRLSSACRVLAMTLSKSSLSRTAGLSSIDPDCRGERGSAPHTSKNRCVQGWSSVLEFVRRTMLYDNRRVAYRITESEYVFRQNLHFAFASPLLRNAGVRNAENRSKYFCDVWLRE